jgi:uncharacterized membrane protein
MSERVRPWVLAGLLLSYLAGIGYLLLQRHQHLMLELDPGALVQMVWLFANHLPLYSTFLGEPLLGEHFSVSFLALVPSVSSLNTYSGLLTLHLSFCGLAAIFLYRQAKQTLEPLAASICTAAILLGPLLMFIFLTPTAYGVQGMGAGILFCSCLTSQSFGRKQAAIAVFALLLMATSYEVSLLIPLGLGCYYCARSETRKKGLVVFSVSLILLILMVGVVVPYCLGSTKMRQTKRYGYLLEGNLPSVITENPGVGLITSSAILLNGACMGLVQPELWLIFLPGTAVNFLSQLPFSYSIVLHYQLTLVPGVFLTMLFGIRRLSERNPLNSQQSQRRLASLCLFLSISCWGIIWRYSAPIETVDDKGELETWSEAMRQIPANASLLMPARLASHLGNRQEVYIYPGNAWAPRKSTEWLLLDLSPIFLNRSNPTLESLVVRDFLTEANFQLRWRSGHLAVYQQGSQGGLPPVNFPALNPIAAGEVYRQAGFHLRAYQFFKLAVAQEPQHGGLWALCGIEAERSGNKEGAHEAYTQALSCTNLDPAMRADIERRLGH